MGTSNWPPAGTSTWPPMETFTRPRTAGRSKGTAVDAPQQPRPGPRRRTSRWDTAPPANFTVARPFGAVRINRGPTFPGTTDPRRRLRRGPRARGWSGRSARSVAVEAEARSYPPPTSQAKPSRLGPRGEGRSSAGSSTSTPGAWPAPLRVGRRRRGLDTCVRNTPARHDVSTGWPSSAFRRWSVAPPRTIRCSYHPSCGRGRQVRRDAFDQGRT
jgi:hypothetical protein